MHRAITRYAGNALVAACALALVCCTTGCKKYPNADRLVNAAWVKNLIDTNNEGKPFVIADVSWGGPKNYDLGHIPGAVHINTDEVEYDYFEARSAGPVERSTTPEDDAAKGLSEDDTLPQNYWCLYPDTYLLRAIAHMGIDIDTTVVLYGKSASGVTYVLWALMYAGVKDVRMMDGGYDAWIEAGYDGTTDTTERTPVDDFGADTPLHPEYLVSSAYVREVVNGQHPLSVIADIRKWEEYTGQTAPYSYIPVSGRIKGALWGHNSSDLFDSAGNFKSLGEIEAMWEEAGITRDKHVSFYCGDGWRSSLAWFTAYRMGWKNIANFDDCFYKWTMGPDKDIHPIEDDYPDLP